MNSFGKKSYCPTSQEMLSCVQGSINPIIRLRIEQHTRLCDFCGGELQLLAKFPPMEEEPTLTSTPAFISLLGINLPEQAAAAQQARAA